jgi:hypothetical protein
LRQEVDARQDEISSSDYGIGSESLLPSKSYFASDTYSKYGRKGRIQNKYVTEKMDSSFDTDRSQQTWGFTERKYNERSYSTSSRLKSYSFEEVEKMLNERGITDSSTFLQENQNFDFKKVKKIIKAEPVYKFD